MNDCFLTADWIDPNFRRPQISNLSSYANLRLSPGAEHPLPAALSLIGHTPFVEITRLDTGACRLFVKLENQNPTGSIKDRVALAIIEAAERDGRLRPGHRGHGG